MLSAVRIRSDSPVVDRFGSPAGLENAWLGGHVFIVLGGPSLNSLDLDALRLRGIVTLAVNNVAGWVRPNLWTFGDSTSKFHDAIWRDPGIVKFIPQPRLSTPLRVMLGPEEFAVSGATPQDMPGVFGLRRNDDFNPDRWLHEDTINWGNSKKHAAQNGLPRVLSTMIQAIRLAYYLGFRRAYLLGCDFTMAAGYRYAFPERRDQGSVNGNNSSYRQLTAIFELLRPRFDEAGFEVLNCNPWSALTVFDHLPFQQALIDARAGIADQPCLVGWYQQDEKKRG